MRAPATMIWHYTYPPNKGFHIGQRGVGMYKRLAVLHDSGLPSDLARCEGRQGAVGRRRCRLHEGYWTTMAPLVIGNHVLVGVSGDFDNLRGFLRSIDPETGEDAMAVGRHSARRHPNTTTGGMTWMTGTYDPDLQSALLGNRQSDTGAQWHDPARRQSLHLQHRRSQSRYRQAGLGLPAFSSRHA